VHRPPRRIIPIAVSSLALLLLPACGGGDDGGAATEPGHVNVVDSSFKPKTISIAVGDTVTWDFKGDLQHNVIDEDGTFKSKTKGKGYTFTHTFNSAGTYDYVCTLHSGMTGTVEVG
jgi:plastocyanin